MERQRCTGSLCGNKSEGDAPDDARALAREKLGGADFRLDLNPGLSQGSWRKEGGRERKFFQPLPWARGTKETVFTDRRFPDRNGLCYGLCYGPQNSAYVCTYT